MLKNNEIEQKLNIESIENEILLVRCYILQKYNTEKKTHYSGKEKHLIEKE